MSLWELIQTSSNSKLVSLSLGKDGATVTCSCIGRYHTIPYSWSAANESARQSKTLCRCWSGGLTSIPAFVLQGERDDANRIYCKTIYISELQKKITLAKHRIFQVKFCRSLTWPRRTLGHAIQMYAVQPLTESTGLPSRRALARIIQICRLVIPFSTRTWSRRMS